MVMTKKEAANILRIILNNNRPAARARGGGKSLFYTTCMMAVLKAINVLEATPDK